MRDCGCSSRGGDCRRDGRRGQRNRFQQPKYFTGVRVVRSDLGAADVEGAGAADGGVLSIRARGRSGNGGDGFASRGGTDPAIGRGRDFGRRGGCVSAPGSADCDRIIEARTAAGDGRGYSGSRHRGNFESAWISAVEGERRIRRAGSRAMPSGGASSRRGDGM